MAKSEPWVYDESVNVDRLSERLKTMLDTKKVGCKIAYYRKKAGFSQDKLAELLRISPQAISKWENGHTLPDTATLPMLAQIFVCSIDELIMPGYALEEKLEEARPNPLETQAELIAQRVLHKLEGRLSHHELTGLDDALIISAIHKAHGGIGSCAVERGKPYKEFGNLITGITVHASQRDYKLIQKACIKNDAELRAYSILGQYALTIPQVFLIDPEKQIILIEDLSSDRIRGYDFNENNENGQIIRENYRPILKAAAKLHAACWENHTAFDQLGTDIRLQSEESCLAHISGMECAYKKYRKKEEAGMLPRVWECFENHLDFAKLDYYDKAIQYLRDHYVSLIESRFLPRKNVTVIHGNLHPGVACMSKAADRDVKFDGLQAVRIGLPTEDLAMLLALHIEPDKEKARPLLDYYYQSLCETVHGYSYDTFMSDCRLSIAENLFFPLRLFGEGIFDYGMRDRALHAFETYILNDPV
jgi:transcriptional regulator with XRE-family HTH domain